METLPKDMLYSIAMNLELPDLLRWCISDKKVLNKVCKDNNFWKNKLEKDYPDYQKFNSLNFSINSLSFKEAYVFLYQLTWIKRILKTSESEYDIFLKTELNLSNKGLTKVPSFNLPNLKILYLHYNSLTKIPPFNLPKLRELYLDNNKLTKVPSFNLPFNLPNLQLLSLSFNQLKEVPSFNLPNLQILNLNDNKLIKVSSFNLPKLRILSLRDNQLAEVPSFNLPNLEELYLRNNNLTEKAKKEITKKYYNLYL